jgi:hypothetical protein
VGFAQYQSDPVGFGEKELGEVYTDDVKQLMESVRDNPITLAKSANATGKTHGAARVAVWWYKCFSGAQVYTAAAPPESNLKKLLWGEIGSIYERHPEIFQPDAITHLHIQRSAQNFLTGVTIPSSGTEQQREAKFSGKHSPYLLFVLDEADAIPDEVYRGIESCMSGGMARLLMMYNPRAEQGEPYRMERDGRANVVELSAFNHPNVITGKDIIPGAVTRETTVRRINEWCRPMHKDESKTSDKFKLPRFLVGATAKSHGGKIYYPLKAGWYQVVNYAFAYMVLGVYPAMGANQLISREWIARARSRWDLYVAKHGEIPPAGVTGIMGQDVGEFGSDMSMACFRYGGFVEQLTGWRGVDPIVTGDKATGLYRTRKIARANVDGTGVGAGVAPYINQKGCQAISVKVATRPSEETELGEFKIMRDQLWWAVREWLRTDEGAMLPPDEELIEELGIATYEIKGGKIMVMDKGTMRELLKRSPDRAEALMLTFFEPEMMFPEYG